MSRFLDFVMVLISIAFMRSLVREGFGLDLDPIRRAFVGHRLRTR